MYEKSNGLLLKAESSTLWEAAEKKVAENRKEAAKVKAPFRSWPAAGGRVQTAQSYPRVGKGILSAVLNMRFFPSYSISLFFSLLCFA